MQQPPGFESSDKALVCKLHKAIYGLKQAPRAWFERLASTLVKLGFNTSKCDPSLFTLTSNGHCVIILVYVDDIIITEDNLDLIESLTSKLNDEFALKQLGNHDGSLLLSQSKYILINTPMISSLKLSKHGTDVLQDPTFYRSIVGALQYVTITRPEICFSVNKACQFLSQLLESH